MFYFQALFLDKEKGKYVSKQKSVTLAQRAFISTSNKAPPYENNVQSRSKKVVSTESVKKQSWPGRTTL